MPDAPVDPITCRCFGDAAGLALELHDLFEGHHAVLLLDPEGHSVDFHIFTDHDHRLSHAICVAMALVAWLPHVCRAVLFSEVERIADLAEDDARTWQQLVAAFDEQGVELLDWIHTDEESVRSMTISCDAEPAWQRADPRWCEP